MTYSLRHIHRGLTLSDRNGGMKAAAIVFLAALAPVVVRAAPDYSPAAYAALPAWENPYVTSSNRLPARALLVPCATRDMALRIAALSARREDSPFVMSLNGKWGFRWAKDPFAQPGPETEIDVPSCWQLQGKYDPVQYCNVEYPHVVDPPRIMSEPPTNFNQHAMRNPTGRYRRAFVIPERWAGRRITLRFHGASSALAVRVNGRDVGYSEDGRLPCEFDVTDAVKGPGSTNEIEATVWRWCDGSYLEDQDFWRLSGIYRDVLLVAEPQGGVYDAVVETTLSDDFRQATAGLALTGGKRFQRLELLDPKGASVGFTTNAGERIAVADPQLWTCETPRLYRLVLLCDGSFYCFNVGFRKVEIRGATLLVNGRRIVVKGVNRHEMSPHTGYTLTLEDMRRDVDVMRKFNVNAVRTCHYPDDPGWYDLCDLQGLWVLSEANVESHGMGYGEKTLAVRPDYLGQHVERGTRMIAFHRNHPSIIIWSMGNEAGYGENFRAEFMAMKELDPSRPIHYEGACYARRHEDLPETEIECPMYAPAYEAGHSNYDYAGFPSMEWYVTKHAKKPFILCEYSHAMGNSNGDFADYWDLVAKHRSAQGGFIWDFADQALWSTDANNARQNRRPPFLAYGGDFGDVPHGGSFNCNGVFDALRNPHPAAFEIQHAYQNVDVVACDFGSMRATVRNNFVFRDLNGVQGRWTYAVNGIPSHRGTFGLRGLLPGETREIDLMATIRPPVQQRDARTGEKTLTFQFSDGRLGEIAWSQFREGDWRWRRRKGVEDAAWRRAECGEGRIAFVSGETGVEFDGATGWIVSFRSRGRELFAAPPRMNFWRAPVDNDRGCRMAERLGVWRGAGAAAVCEGVALGESEGLPQLTATYRVPTGELTSKAKLVETLTASGGVRIDWTFEPAAGAPGLPRVGLSFATTNANDCVCWYGLGPHENYRDRATGARLGVHNAVVGLMDGFATALDASGRPTIRYPGMRLNPDNYVKPGEQGYRTGARWLKLGDRKAPHFEISTLGEPFGFNAWPYPQTALEGKTHQWEIRPDGLIWVNVDADQMGVGGDDSWGAPPHDADLLPSGRTYRLSVLLDGVPPRKDGKKPE